MLNNRYRLVTAEKADGATYTPPALANFVAAQMSRVATITTNDGLLRILDPAAGDGELLLSLLTHLDGTGVGTVEVHGFETNLRALNVATVRIKQRFPQAALHLAHGNFLEFALEQAPKSSPRREVTRPRPNDSGDSCKCPATKPYDLIIANPPYVRTQILGADLARRLASQFGLAGRVDLYHAFIVGMAHVLKPGGIAGIIVSNRFMSTKAGAAVRQAIREHFHVRHVWDLGDTRLFDAAVLPAVLLVEKHGGKARVSGFTSIYSTAGDFTQRAHDVIDALRYDGVVAVDDGRRFTVKQGTLGASTSRNALWRVATVAGDGWLATVEKNTWKRFGDVGKIRVGVKTCADEIFIRTDWDAMVSTQRPELLRPLTTHHIARRFRAGAADKTRQILYPHETANGRRRAIDLALYPRAAAYLREHRAKLEARRYVIESGRRWYEIWVPQDPGSWDLPKLVFRDISAEPTFWIDLDGTIVNGDCYWLVSQTPEATEHLWLAAAVANSSFIEAFYDHNFNNKLYAGRRRFITQYVERFPLPESALPGSQTIVALAKAIYETAGTSAAEPLAAELDKRVWAAFGVPFDGAALTAR